MFVVEPVSRVDLPSDLAGGSLPKGHLELEEDNQDHIRDYQWKGQGPLDGFAHARIWDFVILDIHSQFEVKMERKSAEVWTCWSSLRWRGKMY
jgi:hypothetical protein